MSETGSGDWRVHGDIEVDADDLYALSAATRRVARSLWAQLGTITTQEVVCGPALGALALHDPPHAAAAASLMAELPLTLIRCSEHLAARSLDLVLAADRYAGVECIVRDDLRRLGVRVGHGIKMLTGEDEGLHNADPDSLVEPLAGVLAPTYRGRAVEVAAVSQGILGPAPTGVEQVLGLLEGDVPGVKERPPESLPANRLEVVAVSATGPDGAVRTVYVVVLPGTTGWAPPIAAEFYGDVRNLGANLRLIAGQTTAEVMALPAALAAAGVPKGAQIMFAGHSQGGMTAYAAAGSKIIRDNYRVTHVVTAGSPIGGMAAPAGVRVLSFENGGDFVPLLDGRGNPDSTQRITVTFDGEQGLAGHNVSEYRKAAHRADSETTGPLGDFNASARDAGFFGGAAGGVSRVTRVELRFKD